MAEAGPTVSISTGSRLHFGLFDTRAPFGGVGVMIDAPKTSVRISPAAELRVIATDGDRIVAIAQRFGDQWLGNRLPPCKIEVMSDAQPHSGLGSGTQMALATAVGLARYFGVEASRTELICRIAQRGKRSAVGSIGFFTGGLISEDGTSDDYERSDWWRQAKIADQWRFLLVRPPATTIPISGDLERRAFANLPAASDTTRAELRRLGDAVFQAAAAGDFSRFADGVTRFNRHSGALFAAHQGGCYNGPAVAETIERVAAIGATAYGQSSWGPTVFVVAESAQQAEHWVTQLGADCSVAVARAWQPCDCELV